jgi:hypothetical protein
MGFSLSGIDVELTGAGISNVSQQGAALEQGPTMVQLRDATAICLQRRPPIINHSSCGCSSGLHMATVAQQQHQDTHKELHN